MIEAARFAPDADPRNLPAALRTLTVTVGFAAWQRRLSELKYLAKTSALYERLIRDRHGIEVAFGEVRQHQTATGRIPWPPRNHREYQLYAFALMVDRVSERLTGHGRDRLIGAIRSGLKTDIGLGPIVFEMKTVAHLMNRGFAVSFHDLEGAGGYDFHANKDGAEVEVECKYVSADIGRQIHRRKFCDLAASLIPTLSKAIEAGSGGKIVRVSLANRLTNSPRQRTAILTNVSRVLTNNHSISNEFGAFTVKPFAFLESPFSGDAGRNLTEGSIRAYLEKFHDTDGGHIVPYWSPSRGAVVAVFEGQQPDKVLSELLRHLKGDAGRQFTQTFPAALCVHFADVTHQQLLELAEAERNETVTGIRRAVSQLISDRPHLHTVVLMADGPLKFERDHKTRARSVRETGPTYTFRNHRHPEAASPILKTLVPRWDA